MVDDHLRAFFASHGNALASAPPLGSKSGGISKKRKNQGKGGGSSSKKDSKNPKSGGFDRRKSRLHDLIPDAEDHCLDCGSKDHKRGFSECKNPSWGTKKIRETKDREQNGGNDQGFRGGSGR